MKVLIVDLQRWQCTAMHGETGSSDGSNRVEGNEAASLFPLLG